MPMNGSLKGTRTYFPNVLQFSCGAGFILGGSTERQCLADGSWSGDDTFCKGLFVKKFTKWLNVNQIMIRGIFIRER